MGRRWPASPIAAWNGGGKWGGPRLPTNDSTMPHGCYLQPGSVKGWWILGDDEHGGNTDGSPRGEHNRAGRPPPLTNYATGT